MIVNVTKLAPVSPENTLVLNQSSEEGFDLWPLVTSCFELRDSPFPKRKFSWIQDSRPVIWWRDYKTKNEGPFDENNLDD